MKFDVVNTRYEGPKIEEEVLLFWEKNDVFKATLNLSKERPLFTFNEGPPTANGKPGIHHVLARSFKDAFPRYKTMQGYNVPRKAGWDTHGLPVEHEIEKELGIFEDYFECVISAMWEQDKNISDVEVLKEVLKEGNLDVESIMEIVLSQDCKDKLIKNTDDAVNKGCFGVPTFFYDNQIFFGKDHLHQLEQYINSNK